MQCVFYDMQVGEYQFYRDQLWTAPELLRMRARPINGTQKADVYSFAIVLQEIMFRAAPYFIDIDPPRCTSHSWNMLSFMKSFNFLTSIRS